jgi:hypothetical protein
LQFTAPTNGAIFAPGQPVTISWTGGDPNWLIDISMISTELNAVQSGEGPVPNTGTATFTLSSTNGYGFPTSCGHTYEFYIQNEPTTQWTYGSQFTIVCQIPVAIEIKPGSSGAPINPGSRGTIPVAVLSSSTFDATTAVDRTSLSFGATGNETSLAACDPGGQDVNGDGLPDLVCHFDTDRTGFQSGNTVGVLQGKVTGGITIVGTASVRIVP